MALLSDTDPCSVLLTFCSTLAHSCLDHVYMFCLTGVEKRDNDAHKACSRKSNRHGARAGMMLVERRQQTLQHQEQVIHQYVNMQQSTGRKAYKEAETTGHHSTAREM